MLVVIKALRYFVQFLEVMILIRVIMSWVPNIGYSKFGDIIYKIGGFANNVTEPIIGPVRDLTSRYVNLGPIDISPIIALFLIRFIYGIIVRILAGFIL